MKKCEYGDECVPICDFCKHFSFSEYWCKLKNEERYPTDDCDDFHCRRAKEVE